MAQTLQDLINKTSHEVLVIDSLSYSGNKETIEDVSSCSRFQFIRSNIKDFNKLKDIFHSFKPDRVIHLAAESHVDKSIDSPKDFIDTNIVGTFNLLSVLESFLKNCQILKRKDLDSFTFQQMKFWRSQ